MFVASQTLPRPLTGTSQVEPCEALPHGPLQKHPARRWAQSCERWGRLRGLGLGPQKWGADKEPARVVREILLCAAAGGGAAGSARGWAPVSVGAASAEALLGPRALPPM